MTVEFIKTSLFVLAWLGSGGYVIKQLIGIWIDLRSEWKQGIINFFD